jgi:uncharacterized membrane protein
MRKLSLALAAVALCACQPQAPDGSAAPPPADAPVAKPAAGVPSAFEGDIDASGTEPFWGLQIRETQITLIRPDPEPSVVGPNPGPVMQGGKAVWNTTSQEKPFKVALAEQPGCSDGMSDRRYPLAAEVMVGELTFKGCASKTSEKPAGAP